MERHEIKATFIEVWI